MKRNLVLTVMAILFAIVGVRPLFAQTGDTSFLGLDVSINGVGNRGGFGALPASENYINNPTLAGRGLQPNFQPTFDAVDVKIGDFDGDGQNDVATASREFDAVTGFNFLTILPGQGDGTFSFPLNVPLQTIPVSMNVNDIEGDGAEDLVINEGDRIETFTGFFLSFNLGALTGLDPNAGPIISTPVDNNLFTPNAIIFTSMGQGLSVAAGRFNDDPFNDLVVAEGTGFTVFFSNVFSSSSTFSTGNSTFVPTSDLVASGAFFFGLPAVSAIDAEISNVPTIDSDADGIIDSPDGDTDIFVATSSGVEIFENIPSTIVGLNPSFAFTVALPAGTAPVGLVAQQFDLNADGRFDVAAINRGTGTTSVFLASGVSATGYGAAVPQSVRGANNPVAITKLDFDADGKPDIAIANGAVTAPGNVTILTNPNGNAVLRLAAQFTFLNPTSVAAGIIDTTSSSGLVNDPLAADLAVSNGFIPGFTNGGINVAVRRTGGAALVGTRVFTAGSLATDFDGSGANDDVVLIEQNSGQVFVIVNAATAAAVAIPLVNDLFTARNPLTVPSSAVAVTNPVSGLNDLAFTIIPRVIGQPGSGVPQIVLALNDGTNNFFNNLNFREFPATFGATNLLTGDFDNDGRQDLAFIDIFQRTATVSLNRPDATLGSSFFRSITTESGGATPVSAVAADVDNDGNLDLVIAHQGDFVNPFGEGSTVTVLGGDGTGNVTTFLRVIPVNNAAISIIGGRNSIAAVTPSSVITRIVDFNGDGLPDFAVASTAGGGVTPAGLPIPTVTLLINNTLNPGELLLQTPIGLSQLSGLTGTPLTLSDAFGGPGIVSGRRGANGLGVGVGGANTIMSVADFNADGTPDLVIGGSTLLNTQIVVASTGAVVSVPVNFRSAEYLLGTGTGTVVQRQLLTTNYFTAGTVLGNAGDTFVGEATGGFFAFAKGNNLPDVIHVSVNGALFVDANIATILNHAPLVDIGANSLTDPLGVVKSVEVNPGMSVTVPVQSFDVDQDTLTFSLVASPTGEFAPPFVSIDPMTGTVTIAPGDVNRGPSDLIFRVGVQVSDALTNNGTGGGRQGLIGRAFFTVRVKPGAPPTVAPLSNVTIEAGSAARNVPLNITQPAGLPVDVRLTCTRNGSPVTFVSATSSQLTIAPQRSDVGTTNCVLTATTIIGKDASGMNILGLSSSTAFTVEVTPANDPPVLAAIPAQTVNAGSTATVSVMATDPNGNMGLRLSITGPSFARLTDNGNGTGSISLSPTNADASGSVTVTVTDPGGLTASQTFTVTVMRVVRVNTAGYSKAAKQLNISGSGFGTSGATVTLNGRTLTPTNQSDTSITVAGKKKVLGVVKGSNTLTVTSGGVTSNTVTFNFPQ